jgi:hypothetical protein
VAALHVSAGGTFSHPRPHTNAATRSWFCTQGLPAPCCLLLLLLLGHTDDKGGVTYLLPPLPSQRVTCTPVRSLCSKGAGEG